MEFLGNGSTNVRIEIRGIEKGSVVIGDSVARLSRGVAHLDLSSLCDGEYTPTVFASSKKIPLEKIKIRDGRISRVLLDPEIIERLLSRVALLEDERTDILSRLETLEIAVHPKTLFN